MRGRHTEKERDVPDGASLSYAVYFLKIKCIPATDACRNAFRVLITLQGNHPNFDVPLYNHCGTILSRTVPQWLCCRGLLFVLEFLSHLVG